MQQSVDIFAAELADVHIDDDIPSDQPSTSSHEAQIVTYTPVVENIAHFDADIEDPSADTWRYRASYAYFKRDYARALKCYRELLHGRSTHRPSFLVELYDSIVRCSLRLRDYSTAFADLDQLKTIGTSPDMQANYFHLVVHAVRTSGSHHRDGIRACLLLLLHNERAAELWHQLHDIVIDARPPCEECRGNMSMFTANLAHFALCRNAFSDVGFIGEDNKEEMEKLGQIVNSFPPEMQARLPKQYVYARPEVNDDGGGRKEAPTDFTYRSDQLFVDQSSNDIQLYPVAEWNAICKQFLNEKIFRFVQCSCFLEWMMME